MLDNEKIIEIARRYKLSLTDAMALQNLARTTEEAERLAEEFSGMIEQIFEEFPL